MYCFVLYCIVLYWSSNLDSLIVADDCYKISIGFQRYPMFLEYLRLQLSYKYKPPTLHSPPWEKFPLKKAFKNPGVSFSIPATWVLYKLYILLNNASNVANPINNITAKYSRLKSWAYNYLVHICTFHFFNSLCNYHQKEAEKENVTADGKTESLPGSSRRWEIVQSRIASFKMKALCQRRSKLRTWN